MNLTFYHPSYIVIDVWHFRIFLDIEIINESFIIIFIVMFIDLFFPIHDCTARFIDSMLSLVIWYKTPFFDISYKNENVLM